MGPRGVFLLNTFKNGILIDTYESENLVVNNGRTAVAAFLGAGSGLSVTDIAAGTNSTAPALTDVAPLAAQFSKAIAAVSYPSPGQVAFTWNIGISESNGITINEFGLLLSDNSLFSRKTGVSIVKDNTISLSGTWTIIF